MSSNNSFRGRVVRTLKSLLKPDWLFRQQRHRKIASRFVRLSDRQSRALLPAPWTPSAASSPQAGRHRVAAAAWTSASSA